MTKPELEFHLPDGPWTATGPGVEEQVLAEDADAGSRTALIRWAPGTDSSPQGVARHPFWEEVYLVAGAMHDLTLDTAFTAGMYACRPPGMPHGPWRTERGVTMLVFTYGGTNDGDSEDSGDSADSGG
ncbi:cupin domain-containing protein [Streptomyces griseoviridis]|uniref:cupin domain-containing protein n=1 Tax=Streptomyces griseoviridis TaxID=45398 RepID=UPI003456CE3F